MDTNEMIKQLQKQGYKIEKLPDVIYDVEIGFNGYLGASANLEVSAPAGLDKEELMDYILTSQYRYDLQEYLDIESVEDLGDDEYRVTFTFGGYIGTETEYDIYDADDEDDACEQAYTEADFDFNVIDFTVLEEDYD